MTLLSRDFVITGDDFEEVVCDPSLADSGGRLSDGRESHWDGCLCDAAVPVPPGNGQGCWYKQGDGDVPRHDWTMEESLSAVVMQAEMLLVSRNASAIEHYMPLFLRTCEMLEARRHSMSGYSPFLTGP